MKGVQLSQAICTYIDGIESEATMITALDIKGFKSVKGMVDEDSNSDACPADMSMDVLKKEKKLLVFAPTKFLDQEYLDQYQLDFAQLPFEIYEAIRQ